MVKRIKRTSRDLARIAERDGLHCAKCGNSVGPFELDHEIPLFFHDLDPERWPLARLEADDNLRLLCVECHKQETTVGAKIRKKARRRERRVTKKKTPFPGGRGSGWKRTMSGKVVRRDDE